MRGTGCSCGWLFRTTALLLLSPTASVVTLNEKIARDGSTCVDNVDLCDAKSWAMPALRYIASMTCHASGRCAEPSTALEVPTDVPCQKSCAEQAAQGGCGVTVSGCAKTCQCCVDCDESVVYLPDNHASLAKPMPLILWLHGYTGNASWVQFSHFQEMVDQAGFMVVAPNGRLDDLNNRYWEATDWCCGFFADRTTAPGSSDMDSRYLRKVIESMVKKYKVDPTRIYVAGEANGASMAYRMACDYTGIAGVIAYAAPGYGGIEEKCKPGQRLHVLHIHAAGDKFIPWEGKSSVGLTAMSNMWATMSAVPGYQPMVNFWANFPMMRQALEFMDKLPGVEEHLQWWAKHNGCTGTVPGKTAGSLSLWEERYAAGQDTEIFSVEGCKEGSITLWKMLGKTHFPHWTIEYPKQLLAFINDHPKAAQQEGVQGSPHKEAASDKTQ